MLKEHSSAEEQLLEKGLSDYADAIFAVRRFEELLQAQCRTIMEEYLSELMDATGLKRGKTEIYPYQEYMWKGEVAPSVGAWLEPMYESATVTAFDLGVCWSRSADATSYTLYAYAGIYLRYKQQAVLLRKARFNKKEPEDDVDQNYGHSLTIYEQLSETKPSHLYQNLEKVLKSWLSGKLKIKDQLKY